MPEFEAVQADITSLAVDAIVNAANRSLLGGGGSREAELLASCYRSSIALAHRHELQSIAFPAISAGVYGYPLRDAATIAVTTVIESTRRSDSIRRVVFCCFSDADFELYVELLADAGRRN